MFARWPQQQSGFACVCRFLRTWFIFDICGVQKTMTTTKNAGQWEKHFLLVLITRYTRFWRDFICDIEQNSKWTSFWVLFNIANEISSKPGISPYQNEQQVFLSLPCVFGCYHRLLDTADVEDKPCAQKSNQTSKMLLLLRSTCKHRILLVRLFIWLGFMAGESESFALLAISGTMRRLLTRVSRICLLCAKLRCRQFLSCQFFF